MEFSCYTKAAHLIHKLNSSYPLENIYAIGFDDKVIIGVGVISEIALYTSGDDAWGEISGFLNSHDKRWLSGYIGYDILNPGKINPALNPLPTAHLVYPDTVIEIKDNSSLILTKGNLGGLNALLSEAMAQKIDIPPTILLSHYDAIRDTNYENQLAKAHKWVRESKHNERRITLSRKINLSEKIDCVWSAFSTRIISNTSTPCYWKSKYIEFGGISPERTFHKKPKSSAYHCQKLSGSYKKVDDSTLDQTMLNSFNNNAKLNHEHDLSSNDFVKKVHKIGSVTNRTKNTLDLGSIRHFSTEFNLQPYPAINLVDICRALFSRGVQPSSEGLLKVFEFEPTSRGAYYGMFLMQSDEKEILGTHLIRMLFHDLQSNRKHTHCGACVINESDLEDEYQETKLKLNSIVARILN